MSVRPVTEVRTSSYDAQGCYTRYAHLYEGATIDSLTVVLLVMAPPPSRFLWVHVLLVIYVQPFGRFTNQSPWRGQQRENTQQHHSHSSCCIRNTSLWSMLCEETRGVCFPHWESPPVYHTDTHTHRHTHTGTHTNTPLTLTH